MSFLSVMPHLWLKLNLAQGPNLKKKLTVKSILYFDFLDIYLYLAILLSKSDVLKHEKEEDTITDHVRRAHGNKNGITPLPVPGQCISCGSH